MVLQLSERTNHRVKLEALAISVFFMTYAAWFGSGFSTNLSRFQPTCLVDMRAAGQATYFNAAFHFLRMYNSIFRRISHGATRLQEILAGRVAAQIYDAPAFQGD